MGTWYEIQHTTGFVFQPDWMDCTRAQYTNFNADELTFDVYNSSQFGFLPTSGSHGTASCANMPNGQCAVSFNGAEVDEPNYFILDTDYVSYTMVYACESSDSALLWIMSRTPTMDKALLDKLNADAL